MYNALHFGKPNRHYPHVLLKHFLAPSAFLEDKMVKYTYLNIKSCHNMNLKTQKAKTSKLNVGNSALQNSCELVDSFLASKTYTFTKSTRLCWFMHPGKNSSIHSLMINMEYCQVLPILPTVIFNYTCVQKCQAQGLVFSPWLGWIQDRIRMHKTNHIGLP